MIKKIIALILILSIAQASYATYTRGYFRKDGTYVQGHFRSKPNHTTIDNYSSKGSINPYTLKKGTVDPFAYPKPKRKRRNNF